MKKSFLFQALLSALFSLFVAQAIAQAPDRFNFQAVAKDAANAPIVGNVPVRLTILDGSAGGAEMYKETHTATADAGGVFALQVGGGAAQGGTLWTNINWGSGAKFLKVEIDAGSGFVTMGMPQQLVSVPYAQYALKSKILDLPYFEEPVPGFGGALFTITNKIGTGISGITKSNVTGAQGVFGGSESDTGFGVHANSAISTGTALFADNTSGTWARLGTKDYSGQFNGALRTTSSLQISGENGLSPELSFYPVNSNDVKVKAWMPNNTKYIQFDNYYWRNANPPDPEGGFAFFGGFHHFYGENINLFIDKDGIKSGFSGDRFLTGHKGLYNLEVRRENALDVSRGMRPENTNKQRAAKFAGNCVGIESIATIKDASETEHYPGLFYVIDQASNLVITGANISARIDNTNYKVIGDGAVSTLVKDLDGNHRVMACPEAPEVLFQDFGQGQLKDGRAVIELDPIFTKNIFVDEQHPLRVFIQLRGDCKGVYVENETALGFEVAELQGGKSNVKFTWFVTANRKDEVRGGQTVQYQDNRFKPIQWNETVSRLTPVSDNQKQ